MIPLWLKVTYTLFVCVLVPVYWRQYGLANFLWFSDIALLALVPALWLESPLLISMMALAVVLPELAWNVDYFVRLTTGVSLIGLTNYMFDAGAKDGNHQDARSGHDSGAAHLPDHRGRRAGFLRAFDDET